MLKSESHASRSEVNVTEKYCTSSASSSNYSAQPLAYSVEEACKVAGIGRSMLYEELRAQRLKGRKAGRRTLIMHADLVAYLENLPERAA